MSSKECKAIDESIWVYFIRLVFLLGRGSVDIFFLIEV